MLQAVERQPIEATSSLDERITNQLPGDHQKEIFVSLRTYEDFILSSINLEFI
jgi:hypothetical protein